MSSRRYALILGIPAVALLVALAAGFPTTAWIVPWLMVVLACLTVVVLHWSAEVVPDTSADKVSKGLAAILIVLAGTSGLHWAHSNARPWMAPRVMTEMANWGQTSGELIVHRVDPTGLQQRPARTPLAADAPPGSERLQSWSSSYFSGTPSIGGNANLVGAPAFSSIHTAVVPGVLTREDALAFWSAPGLVMEADETGLPTRDEVLACLSGGACGAHLDSKPVAYDLDHWNYHVSTTEDVTVVFNEAYYPGFTLSACMTFPTSDCTDLPVEMAESGAASTALGVGEWDLVLSYETPGQRVGWIAFWSGFSILALASLVTGIARFRGRGATKRD